MAQWASATIAHLMRQCERDTIETEDGSPPSLLLPIMSARFRIMADKSHHNSIKTCRLTVVGFRIVRGSSVGPVGADGHTGGPPEDPHDLVVRDGDEKQRQGVQKGELDQLAVQVRIVVPARLALRKVDGVDGQVVPGSRLQHHQLRDVCDETKVNITLKAI